MFPRNRTTMDYHALSWTIMDCSRTAVDYDTLPMDHHGLFKCSLWWSMDSPWQSMMVHGQPVVVHGDSMLQSMVALSIQW